jgi:hypothetical protein
MFNTVLLNAPERLTGSAFGLGTVVLKSKDSLLLGIDAAKASVPMHRAIQVRARVELHEKQLAHVNTRLASLARKAGLDSAPQLAAA